MVRGHMRGLAAVLAIVYPAAVLWHAVSLLVPGLAGPAGLDGTSLTGYALLTALWVTIVLVGFPELLDYPRAWVGAVEDRFT